MLGSVFGTLADSFHFVAEGLNLLAENLVEEILLEIGVIAVGFRCCFVVVPIGSTLDGYDDEERSDEGLLSGRRS